MKWIVWGSCLVLSRPLTLTSFDLHVQLATPAVCIVHNCPRLQPFLKKKYENNIRIRSRLLSQHLQCIFSWKLMIWKMNFAETRHDPFSGHTFIFRLRGGNGNILPLGAGWSPSFVPCRCVWMKAWVQLDSYHSMTPPNDFEDIGFCGFFFLP